MEFDRRGGKGAAALGTEESRDGLLRKREIRSSRRKRLTGNKETFACQQAFETIAGKMASQSLEQSGWGLQHIEIDIRCEHLLMQV
jgi:hypothetical protein